MNAWQKWAKGAATATPPCQIRSQDVDWALIGGLTGSHYPAIKALYDRKAFTDEAWQNIEPTMQKLSADFREEPTDSAAAATVDEDCTDADDDAEDDQGKRNIQRSLLLCSWATDIVFAVLAGHQRQANGACLCRQQNPLLHSIDCTCLTIDAYLPWCRC